MAKFVKYICKVHRMQSFKKQFLSINLALTVRRAPFLKVLVPLLAS